MTLEEINPQGSAHPLLQKDKEKRSAEPMDGSALKGQDPSHYRLMFLGFALHLVLVLSHLALLVLYLSLLVFITQKFALRRGLQFRKTLTASHDTTAAWIGLGSALETLFDQISVPSSVTGILLIVAYLLNISVLHITIPALFSVQAFNVSTPMNVNTQGFPQLNTTLDGGGSGTAFQETLEFLPWTNQIPTLGLINGSLYEVLDVNDGQGVVSVPGVGFNITCSSLAAVNTRLINVTLSSSMSGGGSSTTDTFQWEMEVQEAPSGTSQFQLYATSPNITRFLDVPFVSPHSVVLYSTTPIVDSNGAVGTPTTLNPPMGNISELYLIAQLGLSPPTFGTNFTQAQPTQIALHDLENALSSLVASILWTVGHIRPDHLQEIFDQGTSQLFNSSFPNPHPVLAIGRAIVDVPNPSSRLDLSIFAIAFGLAASISLFLLAAPHLISRSTGGVKTLVGGTGVLHIIWLLRNHSEVQELFPEVEEPTKHNLRAAGMVGVGVGM
ncbi:hypothetical protein K438DRAFT_1976997 [Mycena galopus ATCC 62051]|nr:hypothetical protein K438DRAFT_1976997 [Mycena galopus ATCC 62051]